jgi:hypothetical protein
MAPEARVIAAPAARASSSGCRRSAMRGCSSSARPRTARSGGCCSAACASGSSPGPACPVAVALRGYAEGGPHALARIGVGFDGSEESQRALDAGAALTVAAGATLHERRRRCGIKAVLLLLGVRVSVAVGG